MLLALSGLDVGFTRLNVRFPLPRNHSQLPFLGAQSFTMALSFRAVIHNSPFLPRGHSQP